MHCHGVARLRQVSSVTGVNNGDDCCCPHQIPKPLLGSIIRALRTFPRKITLKKGVSQSLDIDHTGECLSADRLAFTALHFFFRASAWHARRVPHYRKGAYSSQPSCRRVSVFPFSTCERHTSVSPPDWLVVPLDAEHILPNAFTDRAMLIALTYLVQGYSGISIFHSWCRNIFRFA